MSELDLAIRLAEKVLEDASRDPDSNLSMLSRQFLRSREGIDRLRSELEALDRSHKDLARKLADAGREINRLRAAIENCSGSCHAILTKTERDHE